MGYGVNQWASQSTRARAAGKSSASSTRTAKRKRRSSAPRARKKSPTKKRRSAGKKKIYPVDISYYSSKELRAAGLDQEGYPLGTPESRKAR